ncbi:hypothetical protein EUGRSUZ_E03380 [Eucalyptus grandis]|uniref:Uncharacterized protein n=2 Tax=Eucalyptus grandis TaxID=71139 RepID=A0ACC3L155_EUCGR|nr:hypothetical protein EUGRSUZ_E03380 [Eucalyptus grandis]
MSEDMKGVPKLLKESAGESSCCIFRVPEAVAGVNAAACWPCTVSFGPYHHGKPALQMLEEHKWRYLPAMLDRIHPHGIGLEDLIGVVGPKEEMIRHCYSESTDMFSGPDFVKMMDDPLLRNSYLFTSLVRDLLRLENQVPYFVLEDLFAITNVSKVKFTLVDLAFRVFSCYLKEPYSGWKRQGDVKGMHLLDSFRLSLIPQGRQNKRNLHLMEVKFDVQSQVFSIPELRIDDTVNCILLNMVAFEQCHSYCDKHVTAYAMFMGRLIQTKMIVSDVAQLFRDVCKDASCDSQADYLEEIGIKKWYTPYRMWKALVKEVYFSNPEVSISVVTLLVTLTGVIQTVYALLQYYQPK